MGKPLIQYTLEMIQRVGIQEVMIATNEKNDSFLSRCNTETFKVRTKRQPKPLGMHDALLHLREEIGKRPCIVMNAGDMVEDHLLTDLLALIKQENPYAAVVGKHTKEHVPAGYLAFEGKRVTGVVEKPAAGEEPSAEIKLMFDYLSSPQDLFEVLQQNTPGADDIYEQALTQLMQEHSFLRTPYTGYWQKLKFPHFIFDMMEVFFTHGLSDYVHPTATISQHAHLEGKVYIDEGVVIEAGAVVKGPAYIGKHVMVGNNSLVRQSMIEEKAVIGFSSEVARSYVGPRCMLHHNFIGDSILECDVNPSWGTTTANWRIDGKEVPLTYPDTKISTNRKKLGVIMAKGVFSGVNCSFMPGVTVGAHARIYPGTTVFGAITEGETYKGG